MRVENLFLFFEKMDMMKRMIRNKKNVMDVLKNKVKARLLSLWVWLVSLTYRAVKKSIRPLIVSKNLSIFFWCVS